MSWGGGVKSFPSLTNFLESSLAYSSYNRNETAILASAVESITGDRDYKLADGDTT